MSDKIVKCPQKYNDLIPIFTTEDVKSWPFLGLFLSMFCKSYRYNIATGSKNAVKFQKRPDGYPQADASNYTGTTVEGRNNRFSLFMGNFLKSLNGKKIEKQITPGGELIIPKALEAYQNAIKNEQVKDFITTLMSKEGLTVNGVTEDGWTFKSGKEMFEALSLVNIFPDFSFKGIMKSFKPVLNMPIKNFDLFQPINYKFDRNLFKNILDSEVEEHNVIQEWWKNLESKKDVVENVFFRKIGEPNKLYTKIDNKDVEIQQGSDEWKKLMDNRGDNCFDMGFLDSGKNCTDFIEKCLAGNGIDECKQFLTDNSYWVKAPQEIASTNPTIAKILLEKFGFSIVPTEYENISSKLLAFESVEKWCKSIVSKISESEAEKIIKNSRLIGFLKLLVEKINNSPGILNKSYSGNSKPIKEDGFYSKWNLKSYEKESKSVSMPSFQRMASTSNLMLTSYQNFFNIVSNVSPMIGGGDLLERLKLFELGKMNIYKPSSTQLEQFYKALITQLNVMNKKLDDKDKENFENLLEDLKTYENKLVTAQIWLAKYVDLLAVHGEEDTNDFISMPNVQKFVDKHDSYFNKTKNTQSKVLVSLEELSSCIDNHKK